MSIEDNKTRLQRFVAESVNTNNLTLVDEFAAPNVIYYGTPNLEGIEALKQAFMMFHTAFPDLDVTIDDMIAEGDKVAAHWTARGTHQGLFLGVPATGKRVAWTGIDIYRYVDGKIVEWWRNDDTLGLMQQLGVLQVPTGSLPQKQENVTEGSTPTVQKHVTLNWPTWVGLVVDDLEAQHRYYRDVVGLREKRAGEGYVVFDVGSNMFELLAKSSHPQCANRGFQIGFAVANIVAVRAKLISRGIEPMGDIESDSGMYWCYFQDPEGNLYEITEGCYFQDSESNLYEITEG